MRFRHGSLIALAAAALLALPASAVAQSAGDEQYADPFQGTTDTEQPAQSDRPASGVAGDEEPPTANSQVQGTPSQTQRQTRTASQSQLAYTGPYGPPLALIGVALLVLGFMLRRLARPAYRMFY